MREKIDQLSFRIARRLYRPLGIQPKTKGLQKNLAEIKTAIKQELEQNPEPIIAVIQARQLQLLFKG
jgi:hypothetical protein